MAAETAAEAEAAEAEAAAAEAEVAEAEEAAEAAGRIARAATHARPHIPTP